MEPRNPFSIYPDKVTNSFQYLERKRFSIFFPCYRLDNALRSNKIGVHRYLIKISLFLSFMVMLFSNEGN